MNIIMTITLACIGSSGFFALIQFILNRIFTKHDNKDSQIKSLKRLAERADTGDLNDSRIQLLILINHYPQYHQEILKEAENYFINLKGDSWVDSIVTNWAEKENVDIEYIKRAHESTVKSNYNREVI